MAIRHLRPETAEAPRPPKVAHTYRLADVASYYGVSEDALRADVEAHKLVVLPTVSEAEYVIHEDDLGRYLADRTVNALTGVLDLSS